MQRGAFVKHGPIKWKSEDDQQTDGRREQKTDTMCPGRTCLVILIFEIVPGYVLDFSAFLVHGSFVHVEMTKRNEQNTGDTKPGQGASDDVPEIFTDDLPDDQTDRQLASRCLDELIGLDAKLLADVADDLAQLLTETFTDANPLLGRFHSFIGTLLVHLVLQSHQLYPLFGSEPAHVLLLVAVLLRETADGHDHGEQDHQNESGDAIHGILRYGCKLNVLF